MPEGLFYGYKEHAYADAFANALCDVHGFLLWVLRQTPFAVHDNARVLRDEMIAARPKAKFWWKNFWAGKCKCLGCSGGETDIFVVLADTRERFALHVEVKQPTDRFDPRKRQGERYNVRAACWCNTPPANVLPHQKAATLLLCSSDKLGTFAQEIHLFDATLTFEGIANLFPDAVPGRSF